MTIPQDFKEFLELLNAHHVEHVVVGGYALAFHGYPRYTGDLDVLVNATSQNVHRVLKALDEFGFASMRLSEQDFLCPAKVIQLGYPPLRIDIVTSIDGVETSKAIEQHTEMTVDGLPLHVLSRELLIQNKAAVGRPQDIADLKKLTEEHT